MCELDCMNHCALKQKLKALNQLLVTATTPTAKIFKMAAAFSHPLPLSARGFQTAKSVFLAESCHSIPFSLSRLVSKRVLPSAAARSPTSSGSNVPLQFNVKDRSEKLLTLSDYYLPGAVKENPHSKECNDITRSICKKFGIYAPGIDGCLSMNAYLYPTASLDRLVSVNVILCMLHLVDDKLGCSGSSGFSNISGKQEDDFSTAVRIICDNYDPEEDSILYPVCKFLYQNFSSFCPTPWLQRLKGSLTKHLESAVSRYNTSQQTSQQSSITLDEYIASRDHDSGMRLRVEFVELAHEIFLPDEVLYHPVLQEMSQIARRIGWLSNDIFSYHKQFNLGVQWNCIVVMMQTSTISFEEAVSKCVSVLNDDMRRFDNFANKLPLFEDSKTNQDVLLFVEGLRNMILTAYHWQFSNNRYRSPDSPFPELRRLL